LELVSAVPGLSNFTTGIICKKGRIPSIFFLIYEPLIALLGLIHYKILYSGKFAENQRNNFFRDKFM
jgi:hypothetical protein